MIETLEACLVFNNFYREKRDFKMQYYYVREGYKFASHCLEYSNVYNKSNIILKIFQFIEYGPHARYFQNIPAIRNIFPSIQNVKKKNLTLI